MTNDQQNTEDRDEVLFAFHRACNDPTAEQIIEWVKRYPQYADDIRAHAALLKDWAGRRGLPVEEPDETMLSRGRSRALNALYNAEVAAAANKSPAPCQSFQQMMAARGTDVPKLARELDIKRSVLADLVNGAMLAPVGKRLVNAIVEKVASTREAFDKALTLARSSPRLGPAKASETPVLIPRKYEEIVRDSGMSAERMRYWLGEDD